MCCLTIQVDLLSRLCLSWTVASVILHDRSRPVTSEIHDKLTVNRQHAPLISFYLHYFFLPFLLYNWWGVYILWWHGLWAWGRKLSTIEGSRSEINLFELRYDSGLGKCGRVCGAFVWEDSSRPCHLTCLVSLTTSQMAPYFLFSMGSRVPFGTRALRRLGLKPISETKYGRVRGTRKHPENKQWNSAGALG